MSLKIGDIDIANQTLDNEFRIGVLERLIEILANSNPDLKLPNQDTLEIIRQEVALGLQKKYPNSGIELRKR